MYRNSHRGANTPTYHADPECALALLSNDDVAARLEEIAGLLENQHANPFRVQAYRSAAVTVRMLEESLQGRLAREGLSGLTRLPGIGDSLARSIEKLHQNGRLALLSQLRGEQTVEKVFATVPGIGSKLAARIHATLGIETLAELEGAAVDGRLATLPGMGRKKILAVQDSLAGRGRHRPLAPPKERGRQQPKQQVEFPPVSEILNIDDEYRRKAEADRLPRIAPMRFNSNRVSRQI